MSMGKNFNKNVTLSIAIMSGANFVTFLVLLWVYSITQEIWFIIAGIAMLISGIAYMIVVNKYRAKINKLKDNSPNEPS